MVLKSTDGASLFEKNVPDNFTVQMDRQIKFEGYWTVALTEINITYKASSRRIQDIYVYSDICEESFVGSSEKPLLRRVHMGKESTEQYIVNKHKLFQAVNVFPMPYYVPVCAGGLNQIHIYITDEQGNPCSFINEDVCVTFHLKKYPFLQ